MGIRSGRAGRIVVALAAAALALVALAPAARAGFGVEKWEAGTCTLATCEYSSPEATFYTQVAGRPPFGITDFSFNKSGLGFPEGAVQDVRVDLPTGLSVNPQATEQCTEAELEGSGCPLGSKVGTVLVTPFEVSLLGELLGGIGVPVPATVYNIVPKQGEPAEFGFRVNLLGLVDMSVYLEGTVSWEGDYHEGFTIRAIPDTVPLARNRLVFEGRAGDGSFITVGSNCNGGTTTGLTVDSHQAPGSFLHYDTTPIEPVKVIHPTGCDKVPFEPTLAVDPGTQQADSPGDATVNVGVPFKASDEIGQSTVKRAAVTLPLGAGLNPAAAEGLKACDDQQLQKGIAIGDRIGDPAGVHPPPIECPDASKIGTVAIDTPVLPDGSINGDVYLGKQLSRDPTSGKEYRVFVNAESPRYGVYVRLIGEAVANPVTGQLTAVFEEAAQGGLPQVPFSSFRIHFKGGDRGPLTSPPICITTAGGNFVPWSGGPEANPAATVSLTASPGGGACAKTMAERPFAPGLDAAPKSNKALTYTPFSAHLTRPQGQQELKAVDVTLPRGATAKLAGVPYCPPEDIEQAEKRAGAAEKKNPSCPDASHVGVATILAGTGGSPLKIEGDAYLAGHYKGAPLSLVVVTPALAGPFDLGTVVVRVALFLDTATAQVHPVAEIPDVFGGAKLDIRSIFFNLDRKEFTLNGTNCAKQATSGTIGGGGADPTNPASFSSFPVSVPFRASGCKPLKFKPRLKLKLFGATHRTQHPRLRAALKARPGDANIGRASVALPHAIFLDQASLGAVCTRPQFAAHECPRKSIYGHARAITPLLGKPLEGPVVLRSAPNHLLPDMVADLDGQVEIALDGRIDSYKGGIRTTFDTVPDVPLTKFVLTLPGGKHGLLVASTNLCKEPPTAIVQLKAQNGRKANRHQKLHSTACGKPHR
jgi:hypothetical protein